MNNRLETSDGIATVESVTAGISSISRSNGWKNVVANISGKTLTLEASNDDRQEQSNWSAGYSVNGNVTFCVEIAESGYVYGREVYGRLSHLGLNLIEQLTLKEVLAS